MTRVRRIADTTFRSLHTRNYRLYFTGQIISVSGTWMQSVALAWLVVHYLAPESQRGVDLGITLALQFLPMLLFGAWGGLVADRVDKRRLLVTTQVSAGCLALVLGLLVLIGHGPAGSAHLWEVYLLSLLLGVVNMFDNPARQTFVIEMVGKDDLSNAVSLNSIVMNGARVIGPAIGGVLIATVGFERVLPGQLGQLRGGCRSPHAHASRRPATRPAGGARQGSAPRRFALRVAHAEPA